MEGTAVYHSPFGKMQLDWEDGAVTALKLAGLDACGEAPNALTARVFRQLDEYFSGTRRTFDFPCRLHGTPFQQKFFCFFQCFYFRMFLLQPFDKVFYVLKVCLVGRKTVNFSREFLRIFYLVEAFAVAKCLHFLQFVIRLLMQCTARFSVFFPVSHSKSPFIYL